MPTDPVGGKPPAGAEPSAPDLEYQVKYQRAFEAVLWSMPAVSIYGFHLAAAELGAGVNVILAWSGYEPFVLDAYGINVDGVHLCGVNAVVVEDVDVELACQ